MPASAESADGADRAKRHVSHARSHTHAACCGRLWSAFIETVFGVSYTGFAEPHLDASAQRVRGPVSQQRRHALSAAAAGVTRALVRRHRLHVSASRHAVKPEMQLRHIFEQMLPQGVRSRVAFAVANAAAGSTGDALAASGGRPLPHRAQHQQEPPLGLAAHLGGPPEDDHLFPLRRCACAHRRQGVAAAATACASRRRSRTALVRVLRIQLQHVKCGSGAARLVGRSRYCRNLWRATGGCMLCYVTRMC